ncbi:hypothetical protein E3N88_28257 [Mikania micrantha]|uniref:Uncharacterized protein n=1 Tax=Mikania micrantha TaxID=192012 RepID=A0A5N6MZZ8_9ASTR|nr:hypothetical protein E3N88_28257 [Mikania micrantha]
MGSGNGLRCRHEGGGLRRWRVWRRRRVWRWRSSVEGLKLEEWVGRAQKELGPCLRQEEVTQTFFNEMSARKQTVCRGPTSSRVCAVTAKGEHKNRSRERQHSKLR